MCAFQWSSESLILRVEEVSTCVDLPPERLPGEPKFRLGCSSTVALHKLPAVERQVEYCCTTLSIQDQNQMLPR